ncbi:MAG TPA: hypothetical protein VL381_06900 [Rhodocyclaceae bacterium]|nr:hypothetical protein [Rhodocyclaceae bacterium]
MDYSLDAIARLRLEAEFGEHANEVMHAGGYPQQALQLRLEVAQSTQAPQARYAFRPEYNDPEAYLQAVYNCQQ